MLSSWLGSNAVAQHPNAATSLKERWAWGLAKSGQGENQTGFWMGYSISRLLDSDAYVGTVNVSALPRSSASRQKRGLPAKELEQDVVFLFNLQGGTDIKDIRKIEVNNRPWILDRDKKPVIWLGRASEEESIHLLLDMYPQVGARKLKARIMVGAELHSEPEVLSQVAALLGREAYAGTDVRLQTDVLDVISHLPQDLGTPLLAEIARTHPIVRVRKEAVGYLAGSEGEKAHEALKSLTRTP